PSQLMEEFRRTTITLKSFLNQAWISTPSLQISDFGLLSDFGSRISDLTDDRPLITDNCSSLTIHPLRNHERHLRLLQPRHRRPLQPNILKKLFHLELPRFIPAWELMNHRLRRPHLRQHLVIGQSLDSIAPAQPLPMQLRVAPIDFETEQVL